MKCARINHLVKLTRSLSESPLTTYYLKRSKEDIRQHVSRNTYQLLDFMSTYISITLAAKPRKVPPEQQNSLRSGKESKKEVSIQSKQPHRPTMK